MAEIYGTIWRCPEMNAKFRTLLLLHVSDLRYGRHIDNTQREPCSTMTSVGLAHARPIYSGRTVNKCPFNNKIAFGCFMACDVKHSHSASFTAMWVYTMVVNDYCDLAFSLLALAVGLHGKVKILITGYLVMSVLWIGLVTKLVDLVGSIFVSLMYPTSPKHT